MDKEMEKIEPDRQVRRERAMELEAVYAPGNAADHQRAVRILAAMLRLATAHEAPKQGDAESESA